MTRFEAARALGVAPSEVRDVEETQDGARVRMTNGAVRLVTPGDGVFACDDHPASAHLRRWQEPEPLEETEEPVKVEDETTDPTEGEVPDGTVEQVLGWVGDDQARAAQALTAEQARDRPRSTLVARLEELREG
jgi:hypothetical protein